MADEHGSAYTTINISGLAETKRAIRNAGADVRKSTRRILKEVGEIVAVEARGVAASRGLNDSGKLIRSIKPTATETSVKVRVTAKRKSKKYPSGYNYPKRYEFGQQGYRAFLRPALNKKKDEVLTRFRGVMDDAAQKFKQ